MKLLLDQNVSHRLVEYLQDHFEVLEHVRNVGLHKATDRQIWEFAQQEGYSIVTKDSDFWERAVLEGPPPKVIWLQIGNCTTNQIKELLHSHKETIKQFVSEPDQSLLTIG